MIILKILLCIFSILAGIFIMKKGPDAFKEYKIPKSFHWMVGGTYIIIGLMFILQIFKII